MSINENLNINVQLTGASVTRASFDSVALLANYSFGDRYRVYESITGAETDESNGDINSAQLDLIKDYFNQSRHPTKLVAGRRDQDQNPQERLDFSSSSLGGSGTEWAVNINGTKANYVEDGSEASISDVIDELITNSGSAGSGTGIDDLSEPVDATDNDPYIDVTTQSGDKGLDFSIKIHSDNQGSFSILKQEADITISSSGSKGDTYAVRLQDQVATYDQSSDSESTDSIEDGLRAAIQNLGTNLDVTEGSASTTTIKSKNVDQHFILKEADANQGSISITDQTPNVQPAINIETELSKLDQKTDANNVKWFGFTHEIIDFDTNDSTDQLTKDIERGASWAESRPKLFFPQTSSNDVLENNSGNVAETLANNNYDHTALWWYSNDDVGMSLAILGDFLGVDPDVNSTIAAYSTLEGISTNSFTSTQESNLDANNVNYYTNFYGIGATWPGKTASGEWIDLIVTVQWYEARATERLAQLFLRFANRGTKVPYTEKGFKLIADELSELAQIGVNAGHFVAGTFDIVIPTLDQIPDSERRSRVLKRMKAGVQPAGAIQKVDPLDIFVDVSFTGF